LNSKEEKKWLAQLAYFYGHLNGICKQQLKKKSSHWLLNIKVCLGISIV